MKDLNDEGHEHVTMVVGDDRVKEFDKLTKKYNGVHYDFKVLMLSLLVNVILSLRILWRT